MKMGESDLTASALLRHQVWESFCRRSNFIEAIKANMDFYAGKQWGNDSNNDNLPRVEVNIIQPIVKNKASKLAGAKCHLTFTASEEGYDCKQLQEFDEAVLKMLNHEVFTYEAYVNAEKNGIEITYVNWDAQHETYGGLYQGGICEWHIDPLCFAVSNPLEQDVQKQEWVMNWAYVPLRQVLAILKEQGYSEEVFESKKSDLEKEAAGGVSKLDQYNGRRNELNEKTLTVYYRYMRFAGEVCYTIESETVSLSKYPIPMSTFVSEGMASKYQKEFEKAKKEGMDEYAFIQDYESDFEDSIAELQRKRNSLKKHRESQRKFYLYPFAIFVPIPTGTGILGYSVCTGLRKIQKTINFLWSNQMKAVENNSYPQRVVSEGALGNQVWGTDPRQILVNYSRNPQDPGFRYLTPPPLSSDSINCAQALHTVAKEINNSSDVSMGQSSGGVDSGYAVQSLIQQANTPLEQEQRIAWKYQKDLARIRIMFYQHYLNEAYYVTEFSPAEYEQEEESRTKIMMAVNSPDYGTEGYMGNMFMPDGKTIIPAEFLKKRYQKTTPKTINHVFNGEALWGIDFNVIIESKQGLIDTEASEQQTIDAMILNGGISKLSVDQIEMYLSVSPSISEKTKEDLKIYLRKMRSSQIQQLLQQNQALQAQLAQMQQALQMTQAQSKEMQRQFQQSMNAANRVNSLAMADNNRLRGERRQATYGPISEAGTQMSQNNYEEGIKHSNSARGIPTTDSQLG